MTKLILTDDAADAPLRITERSAAPTTANTGDLYMDDGTNTGSTNPGWRRYNGSAWEDVSAAAAGSGDVTKVGTPVDNQVGTWTGDGTIEGDANLTFDNASDTLDLIGTFDTVHTAAAANDHALEIDVFAAGFADVKAIDIVYTTGAISGGDEEGILITIDQDLATGGDFEALEVLSTAGGLDKVIGLFAGALVAPIEQLSGIFTDPDSALVIAVDKLADFVNSATNVTMFVADNDTVTIGDAVKFEELEFILSTVASGGGITPTFEFSTGVGTWTAFTPADGTNQFKNTGVIAWLDSQIPTWAVGTGSEFLIRITRTANSLSTVPISSHMQISSATEYYWDENADIKARQFKGTDNATVAPLNLTARATESTDTTTGATYMDDGTNTASGNVGLRTYTGAAYEDVSAGGSANSIAILTDEKATTTDGGASSATTWNARDLNTEQEDDDAIVSIASNQFTPISGTYRLRAYAMARNVSLHRLRAYNVTGTAVVQEGANMVSVAGSSGYAILDCQLTANGTDAFRIDHYTSLAVATSGLGLAVDDGSPEIYLVIVLEKIA